MRQAARGLMGVMAAVSLSSSSSSSSPAYTSHTAMPRRSVASYPSPMRSQKSRQMKKNYNYLTGERMVNLPRKSRNRRQIRLQDDTGLARHKDYCNQLLRDIDEKIVYFKPFVKQHVFFPKVRGRGTQRLFKGNRMLPARTFTRIYTDLIDDLTKQEMRPQLKELITNSGLECPAAADWRRFSDKNGKVTCGLFYSTWMQRMFSKISRRMTASATGKDLAGSLSPAQAYILRYLGDEERVPSLEGWSRSQGPMTEADLLGTGRTQATVTILLEKSRADIMQWGRGTTEAALTAMSLEEQRELVAYATEHSAELWGNMQKHLLFSATILTGINSLAEVKAMQAPYRVFMVDECLRNVVKHGGSYYPPPTSSIVDFRSMSNEERSKYYCFARKAETRTVSASQLYMRYCIRDYGLSRSEAAKRFTQLSDLQQAALQFAFYFPIRPKRSSAVAFRKFYMDMCNRYGLARSTNLALGNKLFEAAMRKRWKTMSSEEREKYFEMDAIMGAFPLQPASSSAFREAAGASSSQHNHDDDGAHSTAETVGEDVQDDATMAETNSRARKKSRRAAAVASMDAAEPSQLFVYTTTHAQGGSHQSSSDRDTIHISQPKRRGLSQSPREDVSSDSIQSILMV